MKDIEVFEVILNLEGLFMGSFCRLCVKIVGVEVKWIGIFFVEGWLVC